MADRFVLLGLAHARSPWFRDLGRWANAGAIPAEFIKCLTGEEVRTRLASGRPFSALLVDGSLREADRDLVDAALETGAAVLIVDDRRVNKDWLALGATRVLPPDFGRGHLLEVLDGAARPITRADELQVGPITTGEVDASWSGSLVAVTGSGGAGVSTVSMALAAALGKDPRFKQLVLLADFALNAEQSVLHDARDIVPGIQELVEAFRTGIPASNDIRQTVFGTDRGNYQILLGLRRHRDWAGLRPRAFEAALKGLLRTYRIVVADIDADIEGENETGVIEIEDRNLLARTTLSQASLTVVVGVPGVKGLHSLVRTVANLLDFGVPAATLLPVINRAPRSPRHRAELSAGFAELLDSRRRELPSPVFISERRKLDQAIRDGTPLPGSLGSDLARGVVAVLGHLASQAELDDEPIEEPEPVPVAPGSLGSFLDDIEEEGFDS